MTEAKRERLRRTFTEDAELYARARPRYPDALFDDLTELVDLQPGRRVLEIGCGTGQATIPLAERGCRVLAVELGTDMAAVARRILAPFPAVEVVTSAFEDWPLPPEPFDLVLSATAFHWIDPDVRMVKTADALRSGGALATISTHHIAGGSAAFFAGVQHCYEQFIPITPAELRLPPAADVPFDDEEVNRSGRFDPPTFRRHEWEQTYTAEQYTDLLCTYSSHRLLAPTIHANLLDCIAHLIDSRHGGQITKRYLAELRVSRTPTHSP